MWQKINTWRISPIKFLSNSERQFNGRTSSMLVRPIPGRHPHSTLGTRNPSIYGIVDLASLRISSNVKPLSIKSDNHDNRASSPDEDEDDELCPVECVREFKSDDEFIRILEKAKNTNSLVVVDFYRTSCGSCKYIEQGFSKLCKASGDEDVPVIFLKHNVMDEYDEPSEVADRLRIKKVPLFHFYKDGTLVEAFATRDKERITEAIFKYISPVSQDV